MMSTDFIIENLEEKDYSQKPREQVRYIGQISAVRYFNPSDRIDAIRLKKIINSPKVQHWMRELNLTDKEYIEWMKDQGAGKNILEISFAKSSDAPSGRMSGGIIQASLQVSKILQRKSDTDPTNILIVAYTDPNNVLSEEILIRSGFKKIGKVDSYRDEQSPNNVFILD